MPRLMHRRRHSNGAATLVLLMLLLGASVLLAAWSQRHVVTELHSTRNQYQRAQALEAAEAGLAWAQALLNHGQAVDSRCRPDPSGGGLSFRQRQLRSAGAAGEVAPLTAAGGGPLPLRCVRDGSGWACQCPGDGQAPAGPAPTDAAPAFSVTLAAGARPQQIDLLSIGCSQQAVPCTDGAEPRADAVVRLRVSIARLPAVWAPPAAVLTARGDINAGAVALGLHNTDGQSGGLAAQAGGRLVGSALRVHTVPGGSAIGAVFGGDEALAALTPEAFFHRHFGSTRRDWAAQAGVTPVACQPGGCAEALRTAIDASADGARLHVSGDLVLDGPLQLGRTERPVVLVVDGTLQLRGAVELIGLVHAKRLQWDAAPLGSGALLRGAVLLDDGYAGDAAPDLVYDAAVIRRLQHEAGTWLRVPGSWRDF